MKLLQGDELAIQKVIQVTPHETQLRRNEIFCRP
jgi:hypothetical protein